MKTVRSQPLYDQIYEYLKENIISGRLKSGARINEAQLARELQVSRGPLREAIRKIEIEGLIVRNNRNHSFVYRPSKEDLVHIYQCRKALESLASELSANNITSSEIQSLTDNITRAELLLANNNFNEEKLITEFVSLSSRFHDIIIISSKNPRLYQEIEQLRSLTSFYRQFNTRDYQRRDNIFYEHREIYKAIASKDADTASNLMKEHIENDIQNLLKLLNEGNV